MSQNQNHVCALSGIRSQEDELVESNDNGIFPDGWIEITIARKFTNPKYDAIQYVKQGLITQYLAAIPEDQREDQIMAIALQVDAQFAVLESQTEKLSETIETVYIANPDENKVLMNEYNKFRKTLGLRSEVRLDEDIPEIPQIFKAEPILEEKPTVDSLPMDVSTDDDTESMDVQKEINAES